jgi:hypothetical protein
MWKIRCSVRHRVAQPATRRRPGQIFSSDHLLSIIISLEGRNNHV